MRAPRPTVDCKWPAMSRLESRSGRSRPISASANKPFANGCGGGGRAARLPSGTRQRRTAPERVVEIERLRRQRLSSPAIAGHLGIPVSTVTSVLRRLGLNRLKTLEPPAPVIRYERERPGELLHLDTKKLGRIDGMGHRITGRRTGAINRHHGIGWEHLHVCIDDASRLAYTEILADERKETAIAFLKRALAWFARHGVTAEGVMTDNGSAYISRDFQAACRDTGSNTCEPGPIRRAPTARPNASSRPSCANAPMPDPSPPRRTAPMLCRAGPISTTSTGRIPPLQASRQSQGSTETTCLAMTASWSNEAPTPRVHRHSLRNKQ